MGEDLVFNSCSCVLLNPFDPCCISVLEIVPKRLDLLQPQQRSAIECAHGVHFIVIPQSAGKKKNAAAKKTAHSESR
jgi:hypothetical protein